MWISETTRTITGRLFFTRALKLRQAAGSVVEDRNEWLRSVPPIREHMGDLRAG